MPETKKILLVDDDPDILEQNKIILESKGFEVTTADTSEEGWKKFQEIKPDAAILDLIMEEYDSGFVLSHKIKRDEHGKNIPVMIITSVSSETGMKFDAVTDDEKEWINADAVLNKPFQLDEVLQKIEAFYEDKD